MPAIKALLGALGLRNAARNRFLGRVAQRSSGVWIALLAFKLIRFVRQRQRRVIARRVIKDGEVLIISSSVNRRHQ